MSIIPFPKKPHHKRQLTKIEVLVQFSKELDSLFNHYAVNGYEHKDLLLIISNRLGVYFGYYMIADPTLYKIMCEQIKTKSIEEAQRRCESEGLVFTAPE
jgi:hypothetical protein